MQHEFDLLVVGSGAGALLGAIRAADLGLKPLVVEKTALVGGTSAISGGGLWIPCNADMVRQGLRDDVATAFRYVRTCAKGLADDRRILAFVETAPELARYLDAIGVRYRSMPKYSDYYPDVPVSLADDSDLKGLAATLPASLQDAEVTATELNATENEIPYGVITIKTPTHTRLQGLRMS